MDMSRLGMACQRHRPSFGRPGKARRTYSRCGWSWRRGIEGYGRYIGTSRRWRKRSPRYRFGRIRCGFLADEVNPPAVEGFDTPCGGETVQVRDALHGLPMVGSDLRAKVGVAITLFKLRPRI